MSETAKKKHIPSPLEWLPVPISPLLDMDASDEIVGKVVRAELKLFRWELRYREKTAPEWPDDPAEQAKLIGMTPEEWKHLKFYWHSFRDKALAQAETLKHLSQNGAAGGSASGKAKTAAKKKQQDEDLEDFLEEKTDVPD